MKLELLSLICAALIALSPSAQAQTLNLKQFEPYTYNKRLYAFELYRGCLTNQAQELEHLLKTFGANAISPAQGPFSALIVDLRALLHYNQIASQYFDFNAESVAAGTKSIYALFIDHRKHMHQHAVSLALGFSLPHCREEAALVRATEAQLLEANFVQYIQKIEEYSWEQSIKGRSIQASDPEVLQDDFLYKFNLTVPNVTGELQAEQKEDRTH